jgi:hypothetical protein
VTGADALADARGRRRGQLAELAQIAAQAVAVQPGAEAAIAACGGSPPIPDGVALQLGAASHAYSALFERARNLTVDHEVTAPRAELCRLLSYHLHMLRDAGDLAFSGRSDPRTEPFRRELAGGLGPYAAELSGLADRLQESARAAESDASAEDASAPWRTDADLELDEIELSAQFPPPGPDQRERPAKRP